MLSPVEEDELILLLEDALREKKEKKLFSFYPDEGPLRRELYEKHLEFFKNGASFMERGAVAANRSGKTTISAFETTLHLTGLYPTWWEGRRFDHPVQWWAASDTSETTRDILQFEFLGAVGSFGAGMIPRELIIGEPTRRRGVSDAVDTVQVKHKSGGVSFLSFKAFDQGRAKFQGTKKHGISLDEEPPADVYFECLTRIAATVPGEDDGLMLCTFTPLKGMSAVVLMYLNEQNKNRFCLTMGFDHAPHLSAETKAKLILSYPPHERDARTKGIPQLGSGAIYPVQESEIMTDDFEIPKHWPRVFSLDVGWNKTACIWGALNRDTDVLYLYSEHYQGQAEPSIHAQAIRARGEWIRGVVDPAARGRSQFDGGQLIEIYRDLGLQLDVAKNSVEAGIYEVWSRLSSGRLKVFKSCLNWLQEFKLYGRDEKGKVVKQRDHLMDATRYLVMSGLDIAKAKEPKKEITEISYAVSSPDQGWMG